MYKANQTLRQLYHILNKISAISINLALTLHKSLITSTLIHAAPIWEQDAKTHFNRL
jgi:hypothetical protein